MYTMEVKDNSKIDAAHTKRLATSKEAPVNSYRENSTKVTCKKKSRTGVLLTRKQMVKKTPKHHGYQHYYILCKKAGMPERKCKLKRSKNCFGKRFDQANAKDGMGGAMGNRDASV